jgi:hypothetical protein
MRSAKAELGAQAKSNRSVWQNVRRQAWFTHPAQTGGSNRRSAQFRAVRSVTGHFVVKVEHPPVPGDPLIFHKQPQ